MVSSMTICNKPNIRDEGEGAYLAPSSLPSPAAGEKVEFRLAQSLNPDSAVKLRSKQARCEPGVAKAQKRNVQSRFWYLAVRSK